jgi:hypothetical protein
MVMAKKKDKDEYDKKKKSMKDEARGSGKKLSPKTLKTLREKAKESGISLATLKKVYRRGLGAYYSSGSRPGMSPHQWAMARVNSFIEGSKKHDTDLR